MTEKFHQLSLGDIMFENTIKVQVIGKNIERFIQRLHKEKIELLQIDYINYKEIVIKIYKKDLKVTLVESLNKRIKFLNEVIEQLNLEKIETIHARAEEFGKNKKYREKFDISTSRAVANLSTLSEYLIPLVKVNGKVISMKGQEVQEEVKQAQKAIQILGGKIVEKESFNLPKSDKKRNIIIIEKIKNTPAKYPRKPGTPAKEPIQ